MIVRLSTGGFATDRIDHETLVILTRITAALLVGGLIGLERSFHGRPAGFRTHALVCVASALLMLVTVYQGEWMKRVPVPPLSFPAGAAPSAASGKGIQGRQCGGKVVWIPFPAASQPPGMTGAPGHRLE